MKVKVVWNNDGEVTEEVAELLHGDERVYLMENGEPIPIIASDLFQPGFTLLEDEDGLWLLPHEDKVSITPIEESNNATNVDGG